MIITKDTNNLKNGFRNIISIMHILASLFYERLIFVFDSDYSIVAAIPRVGNIYPYIAEQIVGYVLAKIIMIIMVLLLWDLVFYLFDNIKSQRWLRFFCIIFFIGLPFIIVLWPDSFMYSPDNLITYSYAIRFFPEYWHNAYSSIVYSACLMVFPNPLTIGVLQWLAFLCVIAYLFHRIQNCENINSRYRYLVFVILLIPNSIYLFTDAYRTEQYAILVMFYISLIVMDLIERKSRSTRDLILLMILSAFISVWRTEGIILGGLGALLLVFISGKQKIKKGTLYLLCFLVSFMLISAPQKLGDNKYYGKDYSIINSFAVLRNILNSEKSNLEYVGANDDISAINEVVPVWLVQLYGMEGYHAYNVYEGRRDINQTYATDAEAKAYTRAFYRISFNNIPIYLRTQFSLLAQALLIKDEPYVEKVQVRRAFDDISIDDSWSYDAWEIGELDLLDSFGSARWYNNEWRKSISKTITDFYYGVTSFFKKTYISSLVLICITLFEVFIIVRDFVIRFIRKKSTEKLSYVSITLLLLAGAIALVMPAGVLTYFHAYYCGSMVLCIVYISTMISKKEDK